MRYSMHNVGLLKYTAQSVSTVMHGATTTVGLHPRCRGGVGIQQQWKLASSILKLGAKESDTMIMVRY